MTFLWPFMLLTIGLVPLFVLAARRIEEGRRRKLAALGGVGRLGSVAQGAGGASSTTARTGFAGGTTADRVAAVLIIAALVLFAIAMARPAGDRGPAAGRGHDHAHVRRLGQHGRGRRPADPAGRGEGGREGDRRPPAAGRRDRGRRLLGRRAVSARADLGAGVRPPGDRPARAVPRDLRRAGDPRRARERSSRPRATRRPTTTAIARRSPPRPRRRSRRAATRTAAIILFSDGENNERPDPVDAAQVAANEGVRILTIGVGTTAGTTLDLDGFKVQTALDESLLQQVSDLTKGTYAPAASADPGTVYYRAGRAARLRATRRSRSPRWSRVPA